MKKERYIPSNFALSYIHEGTQFLVYSAEVGGRFYAIAYKGKAAKSVWYYQFKNQEALQKKIEETVSGLEAWEAKKLERRAKQHAPHTLKVGEILRSSWGWEQTNVQYYQVVGVTRNSVALCEVAQNTMETGFMCGECTPVPNQFIGKVFNRKVSMASGSPTVRITKSEWASLEQPLMEVNGQQMFKPRYFSYYA
jgi:hypothetical protein